MATYSITVKGFVQGVGFRSYVKETAFAMQLKGEAWNARGGTVRAIVQHQSEASLKRFAELMWHGPGRVDAVEIEQVEGKDYSAFEITETRD